MRSPFLFRTAVLVSGVVAAGACSRGDDPDAYGNFEANEVVVASEAGGQLQQFTVTEGARLDSGAVVGLVDTTQLALERRQILASGEATKSRATEAGEQIVVLETQREIARRAYERAQRLAEQHAATAQQLDQAERDYRVLVAQIAAARSRRTSVAREGSSSDARVAQITERLAKSRIENPAAGTVLATYVRAGEVVQPGQPLYRIANLDSLTLRAYVSEPQLTSVRIGQPVRVHVDRGDGGRMTLTGTVTWVASKAEFTPTPVQTRDERATLVYAVKVLVPNRDGALKIGMPADLALPKVAKGS